MRKIVSLRLLPPFAIARLGSGETPMDNYTLEAADPNKPLDFRKLKLRQTLGLDTDKAGDLVVVELKSEEDVKTDEKPRFKEPAPRPAGEAVCKPAGEATPKPAAGSPPERFRPVAPFIEAFAQIEGSDDLIALDEALLQENNLALEDVSWRVCVANRKAARRTNDENDAVIATATVTGHDWVELQGRCPHFCNPETDYISFGKVAYPKPRADFPGLRLRFHPAKGLIYGPVEPSDVQVTNDRDPNLKPYEIPQKRAIYDNKTKEKGAIWAGLDGQNFTGQGAFNETLPPGLFAISSLAPNWLHDNIAISRGYLDDACDGFVELRVGDLPPAFARICAAPPATAPDAQFLRTLADDLDQAILGPEVGDEETPEQTRARALDIVRRAFETVSFMNVAVMNGNNYNGRSALILDSMPEEEAGDTERMIRPVMAPTSVDTFAIKMLHQQAYAAIRGGVAPWFSRLLRRPDEAADYTDFGRRKMPALMCGADNNYLALTWRQIHTIEKTAAAGPLSRAPDEIPLETGPETLKTSPASPLKPRNLTAQIRYAAQGNPISTLPVTSVANCCPGLEVDFRAIWRRLFKGIELREWDNLVVRNWPDPSVKREDDDFEPTEEFVNLDSAPVGKDKTIYKLSDMPKRRLLRVRIPRPEGEECLPVVAVMKGPATTDSEGMIDLTTAANPNGVAELEWSNALTKVLAFARASQGPVTVRCDFSAGPVGDDTPSPAPLDRNAPDSEFISFDLEVRPFFEDGTAVISRALARAGELTQGLCSPWQNDYRECSCYYWASARPDFVNVEVDATGLSRGDNWMSRERIGRYIADDYKDGRLMMYDELFRDWEDKLKVIVGGRDYAPKTS